MSNKFKLPTEVVELPSKGVLYPKTSPLAEGKIEMKYMTAREEDILTNQNYIRQGTVIQKLMESMIVTEGIDYNDLLLGDKDAILLAARILGYGKNYEIKHFNKDTGEVKPYTVDLTSFKEKPLEPEILESNGINEFTFTLPSSGNNVTVRLLTEGLEKQIENELEGLRKLKTKVVPEATTRLKYHITSVEGSTKREDIKDFVDNYLLASDSRALRNFVNRITPGLDLTFTYEDEEYVEEGVQLPIGLDFFWPDA